MRENYLSYRDIVFVNKRFQKCRFNRVLLMFCGVTNTGKSVLLGFAFLQKDDSENIDYAVKHFGVCVATEEPPKLIIIERHAAMRSSLQKGLSKAGQPPLPVLYCNYHYQKSIRDFFDSAKDS